MKKKRLRKPLRKVKRTPALKESRKAGWLMFLAYLAYLRAIRPQKAPETGVLRTLIVITGLVLVVLILAAAGAPEVVSDVMKHWPSIP